MSPDADLAAVALVDAASAWLQETAPDEAATVVAVELAVHPIVALGVPGRALWKRPAGIADDALTAAAHAFAIAVLDTLPELTRVAVGYCRERQGGELWAYARPGDGAATLAIMRDGQVRDVASRTVEVVH